jgi:hypothetical protein
VIFVGVAAPGCRARLNANASLNTGAKQNEEFSDTSDGEKGQGESDFDDADTALLGARHDLRLATTQGAATCKCLSVVVGGATAPGLVWQGPPPKMNAASQLVLGLSSEGAPCEGAPEDSLGASYWGYRLSGEDVIVIVESARFGKPITQGAIIPKPFGTGQIYIKPASANLPYGRPLNSTDTLCKVYGGATAPGTTAPTGNMESKQ